MAKCPFRIWVAIMVFCAAALNYAYRVYFQLAFIAFLSRNETLTEAKVEQPDYGPRYEYNNWQEGLIIGAYFYGQTISSIPAGPIVEVAGPWLSMVTSAFANAVFTLIAVFVIDDNWIPLFVLRFLIGLSSGFQYPAMQSVIGRWAPPLERGKFAACLMGNVFGSVAATIITGALIPWLGWKSSFWGMIIVTGAFCILWFVLIADYPSKSWFCSQKEIDFITESQGGSVTQEKVVPPFLKIATSIPFIVLVIGQFGSLWGLNLIVTSMPKFMDEILGFNLQDIGIYASLPSLARLITGFIFGSISDVLLSKEIVKNKSIIRKGFVLFSHILPGISLFCYTFIGTSPGMAIGILVIMLAFNGATVTTMLVNSHDLAPNFAGTLYGIMNAFGSTPGFIIPAVNAEILKDRSSWPEWTIIFCIGGGIYIATGVLFIIFGSTKLQSWNEKKVKNAET